MAVPNRTLRCLVVLMAFLGSRSGLAEDAARQQTAIIVVGAPGADEFAAQFAEWSARWTVLCEKAGVKHIQVGASSNRQRPDLGQLEEILATEPRQHAEPLWIVLIGHGTFDGRQAKFNLQGPDLTAKMLATWLAPFQRTVVIINCASASSPFINQLAGEKRVVVTATKSGFQHNFARFGRFFAEAIGEPKADLDKDGQTSLLEAYLLASSRVEEFYKQEARLATEHALLDDNGDGQGTPASWFRGIRVTEKPKNDVAVDGLRANQLYLVRSPDEEQMPAEVRQRRDQLEQTLQRLRERKPTLTPGEYYAELQPILVAIARLYESVDKAGKTVSDEQAPKEHASDKVESAKERTDETGSLSNRIR